MIQVNQSEPIKPQIPKPIVLKLTTDDTTPSKYYSNNINKKYFKSSCNNYCDLLKEINKTLNCSCAIDTYKNVLEQNSKNLN